MSHEPGVVFNLEQSYRLLELIRSEHLMGDEESEAAVYALLDMAKPFEEIYFGLIPRILSVPHAERATLQDWVWEIREQLRHIDYHIHDGWLPE